jgi:hypothetical protein
MLKRILLALTALATIGVAQSPLVTLNTGGNSGNVGGGLYFDLQVNTTVTFNQIGIRSNTTAASAFYDIYLGPTTYVGNVTNPALWTLVASTVAGPTTLGATTVHNLTVPFALGPGNYGVALKSNATSFSYTNGAGNNTPLTCGATPGSCLNSFFSNSELTLRGGAAQNAFLSGGIFSPRVFNGSLHYTLGGTPIAVAAWQKFGNGCYDRSRTLYEFWPSSVPFDFGTVAAGGSGITSMRLQFAGNRYLVSGGTTPLFTHSGTNVPLGLGDDVEQPITLDPLSPTITYIGAGIPVQTNQVFMCSNGFVSFSAPNATLATLVPAIAPFLANNPIYGNWHDLDPSQAGATTNYEYDPTLAAHVFSWLACPDWNIAGSSNSFQLLFFDNGDVEYRWGAMSQSGGGAWPTMLGYSPGGGARDDGGGDLSARLATPFLNGDVDNAPLDLSLSGRPLLGQTASFMISDLEPTQAAGFLFLSFVGQPNGTSLIGFGMPECMQWINFGGSISTLFIGAGTASVAFPIGNNTAFNGVQLFGQAAAFGSSFNQAFTLGVNASNGVRMTLGNL